MTGHSPAGPLMTEHRVIERMLHVLEAQVASFARTRSADPAVIDLAVDFIRTYADRCHHGKEEDILFRRLADKQLDADLARTMAELIDDHVRGREMTRGLADANERNRSGDASALDDIGSSIAELVAFYPTHIEKEDRHFFKPCLEYFSDSEKQEMLAEFEAFDRTLTHEIHKKYLGVVESLERAAD